MDPERQKILKLQILKDSLHWHSRQKNSFQADLNYVQKLGNCSLLNLTIFYLPARNYAEMFRFTVVCLWWFLLGKFTESYTKTLFMVL